MADTTPIQQLMPGLDGSGFFKGITGRGSAPLSCNHYATIMRRSCNDYATIELVANGAGAGSAGFSGWLVSTAASTRGSVALA